LTDKKISAITIYPRHVRIGGQVYPLAHISRMQTFWFEWGKKLLTPREAAGCLIAIAAALVILPALGAGEAALTFFSITALVVICVAIFRFLGRKSRFVLSIETSGAQSTALLATTEPEILRIAEELVSAIENPPSQAETIYLQNIHVRDGDVVYGDKIDRDKNQQFGSGGSINSN
jgi:hypothetical protein